MATEVIIHPLLITAVGMFVTWVGMKCFESKDNKYEPFGFLAMALVGPLLIISGALIYVQSLEIIRVVVQP